MKYTIEALEKKIREMFPEVDKHELSVGIKYSEVKDAFIVTFKRGRDELITQLDRQDADDCMNNIKCVHLGVQVGQFVKNFEERIVFGRKVA